MTDRDEGRTRVVHLLEAAARRGGMTLVWGWAVLLIYVIVASLDVADAGGEDE